MPDITGNYHLSSVNGNAAKCTGSLTLTKSHGASEYTVHARIANVMNGKVAFQGGELKGLIASTMMFGSAEEMQVERILGKGFHKGMAAKREDDTLTLSVGEDELVFQAE